MVWGEGELATEVYPLAVASILAVAACLKAGRYRSSENYFSDARDEHLALGFPWSETLTRAVRNATRSTTHGSRAGSWGGSRGGSRAGRRRDPLWALCVTLFYHL